jgi:hypothetical protein
MDMLCFLLFFIWLSKLGSNISGNNILRKSESSVLNNKLFGPKMDEVAGGGWILVKDRLQDLNSST